MGSPAMKSTCKYRTRPASLLCDWMAPVSTDVMERIDVAILVPYHEEVPPKHLQTQKRVFSFSELQTTKPLGAEKALTSMVK